MSLHREQKSLFLHLNVWLAEEDAEAGAVSPFCRQMERSLPTRLQADVHIGSVSGLSYKQKAPRMDFVELFLAKYLYLKFCIFLFSND